MKTKIHLAGVSTTLFSVFVLALVLLTGCADSALTPQHDDAIDNIEATTTPYTKLRNPQQLDHITDTAGKTTSTIPVVIGMDETILQADRLVRRHRLVSRYRLVRRHDYDYVFYGLAAEIDKALLEQFLEAIENDPDIAWAELDLPFVEFPRGTAGKKAPTRQLIPWGIDRIGATESSTRSGNGSGSVDVDIYILDSGVRHRDMTITENLDFIALDKGSIKKKNKKSQDVLGHGTMAASIAGAIDDAKDLVGVAPGARIHNWKVLGDNGTVDSATPIAALDLLIKRKQAAPTQPMVANLSFGADTGSTDYGALDEAVQAAIDAGIVVVVSAGNQGIDASTVTPAHVADAITVGAYDALQGFASFSNHGAVVDLLAPGVDVVAISNNKKHKAGHVMMMGTSFAAPHVTGAVALYLSQHPLARPGEVRAALVGAAQGNVWGVPAGTTNKGVWVGDF